MEKREKANREFKKYTGDSPNAVANKWLAAKRGERVTVYQGDLRLAEGILLGWDLYSLLVEVGHDHPTEEPWERLIFKGPGVWIEHGK